jgi:hypothetical protein
MNINLESPYLLILAGMVYSASSFSIEAVNHFVTLSESTLYQLSY